MELYNTGSTINYTTAGVITIVIITVITIATLWIIYNTLTKAQMFVEQSWSQVDVQLTRRADLVPALIKIVVNYDEHEKLIHTTTAILRSSAQNISRRERGIAETGVETCIRQLSMIVENYPQLKSSQQYTALATELTNTEDRIAAARGIYNSNVAHFNTLLRTMPIGWVGAWFNFSSADFFQADPSARNPVVV